jgi:hypothetical protein
MAPPARSPAGGSARPPGSGLPALVQQIGAIIAQGEDSGSQSQAGEVRARLRAVLLRLLDVAVAAPAGAAAGGRELGGVLRLLNLALEKVPNWVAGDGGALLMDVLRRLAPVLTRPLPAEARGELAEAAARVLARLAAADAAQFAAAAGALLGLLEDGVAVAAALSADPGNGATIACGLRSLAAADSGDEAPPTAVVVDGPAAAERLLSGLLRVLARALAAQPLLLGPAVPAGALHGARALLLCSSAEVAAGAMRFLAAALRAAPSPQPALRSVAAALPAALAAFTAQQAGGAAAPDADTDGWWTALTRLLNALADADGGAAARARVAGLALAAAQAAPAGGAARGHLCGLFAELATAAPEALRHAAAPLGDLLATPGGAGRRALLDVAALALQHVPAKAARRAVEVAAGLAATEEGEADEADAGRPAKRARLRQTPRQRAGDGGRTPLSPAPGQAAPAEPAADAPDADAARAAADALAGAVRGLQAALAVDAAGAAADAADALAEVLEAVAEVAPGAAAQLAAASLAAWPAAAAAAPPRGAALPAVLRLASAGLLGALQPPAGTGAGPPCAPAALAAAVRAAAAPGADDVAPLAAAVAALLAAQAGVLDAVSLADAMAAALRVATPAARRAAAELLPAAAVVASARDARPPGGAPRRGRQSPAAPPASPLLALVREAAGGDGDDAFLAALARGLQRAICLAHEPALLAAAAAAAARGAAPAAPPPPPGAALPAHVSAWALEALEALRGAPGAREAARAGGVAATLEFLARGALRDLELSRPLAAWVLEQATSPSLEVQAEVLRRGGALAATQFVLTLLHEGAHPTHSRDRAAAAERLERGVVKALHEALQAAAPGAPGAEAAAALVARAGAAAAGGMARLMALAILVGALAGADPVPGALAAAALRGLAAAQRCSVRELLCRDPHLLQHVGKQLPRKPDLLLELAELAGVRPRALAAELLPHALPALFAVGDRAGVEAVARLAGLEPAKVRMSVCVSSPSS